MAVCGFARVAAGVVVVYVAGLPPGEVVTSGCKTGFSEHPDKITHAITRPVTRENTILVFNPASLLYYADEIYGQAGKYSFTVFPDILMKTRRPPAGIHEARFSRFTGTDFSRRRIPVHGVGAIYISTMESYVGSGFCVPGHPHRQRSPVFSGSGNPVRKQATGPA
jgi:hypothetical protein